MVRNGQFLFSDSGHTFTSELIFFTFLLDLGLIKKWSVITPCLSLSAGYAPSVFGKGRILNVSLVFRIHIFWQMKKSSIFNSTLMFCGKVFTRPELSEFASGGPTPILIPHKKNWETYQRLIINSLMLLHSYLKKTFENSMQIYFWAI